MLLQPPFIFFKGEFQVFVVAVFIKNKKDRRTWGHSIIRIHFQAPGTMGIKLWGSFKRGSCYSTSYKNQNRDQ
ncbi:Putative protein [Zobellia galactanivorans]|uniref:Uncharacterized protein n=1 Tax=Zobellia galactanivorans (strain DSM 12802 / CCUG 47099 / CIP 106680 / NCIMB 13871 / Dsij) TaxID=63186 RepID=G0L0K4_ZOBGA|nr:Putative protein [Zobellia galactanivorans]